jgi:Rieske Fe-S protein
MTEPSAPSGPTTSAPVASRRTVLACASVTCAAVLAGCTRYDSNNGGVAAGQPAYTPPAPASSSSASSGGNGGGGGGAAANVLAKTSDVPVGGGKILTDKKIVITQPTAGAFHAFTAVCTHAGCIVDQVGGGTIDCPCHGSKFSANNGSVVNGPAASPLAAVSIKVKGTNIVQA